jgi:hypothetical protein
VASGDIWAEYTVTVASKTDEVSTFSSGAWQNDQRTQVLDGAAESGPAGSIRTTTIVSVDEIGYEVFILDPSKSYTLTITEN